MTTLTPQERQDELYEQFLSDTAQLRSDLEAKINELQQQLALFREPFDREFMEKTSAKKESLLPEINEIEAKHRYECHKAAVVAHRKIDKLEKKRNEKLKPVQAKWEAMTEVERAELEAAIKDKVVETNAAVEALVAEFNAANEPAHKAYLEKAKALELEILNTPASELLAQ